jgi:hypothetical protein
MTDQALDILKLVLLGLLYLFFARVLWAVWSEVRRPSPRAAVPAMPADERDATTIAAPAGGGKARKPPKGRAGRVARLVIIEPKAHRGQTYALNGEITIGRDPASTIVITDDTFVSSHHARVFDVEGQPMVEDLGSTNGSFHNGTRLQPGASRLLHPGDRVQVGYTVLEAQ